jgi:hypothetical protein
MATEVLELSVKTNIGQSITSLKELKDAIKAAKDEQIAMANQFGATSQEAINASKRLAELQDSVDDLNDSSKSLKGSGFEMLKQGFGDIREGLMNLDFDKVKVGLTGMGAGFTSMGKTAKAAFTGIKGAIAATGIGLLVIALGTIYAYWDDIKGVVSGVTSEQKKLNAEAEKNVKIAQDNLDIISQQENILKLQGKSEKEILNMKIAATAEAIEETKIKLHQQKATRDAQIDAAKRNKTILEGFISFVSAPIMLLLKGIDLAGKALGKDFELAKGFTGSIAGLVFDPEKVAANVDSSIAETEKGLRALENASAGHKLTINNINKEANKKDIDGTKETADKKAEIENENAEKKKQLLEDFAKAQKTAEANELQAIKDKYKDVLAVEIEGSESKKQLLENEEAELKAIRDKYEEERRVKTEEELKALTELQNENTLALIEDVNARALEELEIQRNKELESVSLMENAAEMKNEINKKYDRQVKSQEKVITQVKKDNINEQLSAYGNLAGNLSALAGDNKELAAASAIIDTYVGANKAFAQGGVVGYVGAAAVIAAGLANVQKIYSTPVGDSGGGGETPAATTPAPQMMSGAFELGGGVKPEPMKAFVVTDEMSNSQSQLANIRRRATI